MNPIDVEAARRDIGRDEHLVLPAFESFHRNPPLILTAIGVQRGAADAGGGELSRQPVGADLRPHEHQHRPFRPAQVLDQPFHLVRRGDVLNPMCNAPRRRASLPDLHVFRVARNLKGVAQHLVGQRGREEQRLPAGTRAGKAGDDSTHVGPEAHVHHAVGFVENQQLDAGQIGILLAHVIHQPPGRGDDDVDARLERAFLRAHFHAAVDRRAGNAGVIRQPVDLVFDLHRELARRCQHQHA